MNAVRIGGTIRKLKVGTKIKNGYGIIVGDDGRHYLFLPSYLRSPHLFPHLAVEMSVMFFPVTHPRGMRASGVTVTSLSAVDPHASITR